MLLKKNTEGENRSGKSRVKSFIYQRQWKLEPAVEWRHPLFTWRFQSLSDVTPPAFNAGLAQATSPCLPPLPPSLPLGETEDAG